jgi:hypothetical protein
LKKILIISQHISPIQTPRSHRTIELAKELSRQGHDVTIYSVLGMHDYTTLKQEFNFKIKPIRIAWQMRPYNSDGDNKRVFIDKALGKILGGMLEFPNIEFMYKIPEIIKNEKNHDLLISIADPHQIHWGCARARLKFPDQFPKKWIADCGDPFMENGDTKYHRQFFSKYEKLFCKQCDYITVPHEKAIDGYYPEYRSKISVIPQGFEFDLNPENRNFSENKVLTFSYAGVFLKDIRNPASLLEYLTTVETNFKFIIYTPYTELLLPYKKALGDKLEIRSTISRKSLIESLKSMDFLLNLENVDTPTAIPSKLIDYAIVGRPILSINHRNIDYNNIDRFLKRDYSQKLIVKNLSDYHISNVAKKFIYLAYDIANSNELKHS